MTGKLVLNWEDFKRDKELIASVLKGERDACESFLSILDLDSMALLAFESKNEELEKLRSNLGHLCKIFLSKHVPVPTAAFRALKFQDRDLICYTLAVKKRHVSFSLSRNLKLARSRAFQGLFKLAFHALKICSNKKFKIN